MNTMYKLDRNSPLPIADANSDTGYSVGWVDIERRRGRFSITDRELHEMSIETAMRIFGQMIIVRAEHHFFNNTFEYCAMSPLFRIVDEGEFAPSYRFEVDEATGSITAVDLSDEK